MTGTNDVIDSARGNDQPLINVLSAHEADVQRTIYKSASMPPHRSQFVSWQSVNPYEPSEVQVSHHEPTVAGPVKPLLYVLSGCSVVVPGVWISMQLLGETWWLALLLVLSVFASALVFSITYCATLILAFGSRRWQPAATGLVAGVAAIVCAAPVALPSPIKAVWIPLATAAVTASILIRARDLDLMNDSPKGSLAQWLCILITGVMCLWVGVAAEIGKPILIALNQDVVGAIRSEKIEIAVTGGIAGAAIGVVFGILAYSAFWQHESPAINCVNRSDESGRI